MNNPPANQANEDLQYRTLLTLWGALLGSILMYFVVTFFIVRPAAPENHVMTIVLSAMSAFLVVASFVVKKRFLSRSIDSQNLQLVRTGSIVSWAICEAAAIFGLLDFFLGNDRYYFVLMAFAFIGMLLHFPKRREVVAANFSRTHTLN